MIRLRECRPLGSGGFPWRAKAPPSLLDGPAHRGGEAATGREALLVPDATQDPSLVSPHLSREGGGRSPGPRALTLFPAPCKDPWAGKGLWTSGHCPLPTDRQGQGFWVPVFCFCP